ncbi:hypothetical protein MPLDJ20_60136 [Mesorhizobium plurifarium]|uniref:Transposase n=1 Tax=Mesorhizobium plurifarium TaxID=69974 RepID=A0A090FNC5_MESPL|nr:hypothetical protein MPLDJ20_60136 [Mesorhizobium plurifarium]
MNHFAAPSLWDAYDKLPKSIRMTIALPSCAQIRFILRSISSGLDVIGQLELIWTTVLSQSGTRTT